MGDQSSKPHILWSSKIFLLLVGVQAEILSFLRFPPFFCLAEGRIEGTIDRDGTFWSWMESYGSDP